MDPLGSIKCFQPLSGLSFFVHFSFFSLWSNELLHPAAQKDGFWNPALLLVH